MPIPQYLAFPWSPYMHKALRLLHPYTLPATATIQGIMLTVSGAWCDPGPFAQGQIDVELSWDGGGTWTNTFRTTGLLPVGPVVPAGLTIPGIYNFGGPTDNLWGRGAAWEPADVNNIAARVTSSIGNSVVYMDWIPITVWYTLPSQCFIATATYDTPSAKEVQILRDFRDQYLLTNPGGEKLTSLYYKYSPPIADFITEHPVAKPVVRAGLFPAVAISSIAINTSFPAIIAFLGALSIFSVIVAMLLKRGSRRVLK